MITDKYEYETVRAISFMFYIDGENAEEVADKYIPILAKTFPEYSEFEFVKQSTWAVVIYPKDHIVERRVEYAWHWEEDFPVIDQMNVYDDEARSIEDRFYDVMHHHNTPCEVEFDYEDNIVNVINDIKSNIINQYGG